jgi:hypothetical protein
MPTDNSRLMFLPAPFIHRIIENNDPEKPVGSILNLDEISCAPPAVQAGCLRLVLDRWAGDTKLPDNCAIVAAANPPEIAAGGWELSLPLANRFVHLQATANLRTFQVGMLSGWPAPNIRPLNEDWEAQKPWAHGLTTSFLQKAPHRLDNPPKEDQDAVMAFPTPRTWEYAGILLAACRNYASEETQQELLSGAIGMGAATEFLEYMANVNLPDPEALLKKPKSLRLTDRGDESYAILTGVISAVLSNNTPERWQAGWNVLGYAVDQNMADVAAVSATVLAANQPGDCRVPESAAKFGDLITRAGLVS